MVQDIFNEFLKYLNSGFFFTQSDQKSSEAPLHSIYV